MKLATNTYVSELIRDWGRKDITDPEFGALIHHGIIRFHPMGVGVEYADFMVPSYLNFKGF
jgi:hypothetical protein